MTKEEQELKKLKSSARLLLSFEIYDALTEIADSGCTRAAVFTTHGPCKEGEKPCAACVAKKLMQRMQDKLVRASWLLETGAELITAERERQVEEEGFLPEHDDDHQSGELAMAAACYAAGIDLFTVTREQDGYRFRDPWPWEAKWDKRGHHDRLRELVKAGALIAAEIDRIKRREVQIRIEKSEKKGDSSCVTKKKPTSRAGRKSSRA